MISLQEYKKIENEVYERLDAIKDLILKKESKYYDIYNFQVQDTAIRLELTFYSTSDDVVIWIPLDWWDKDLEEIKSMLKGVRREFKYSVMDLHKYFDEKMAKTII